MRVIKKDNTVENFNIDKIINAISKSSHRVNKEFNKDEIHFLVDRIKNILLSLEKELFTVDEIHNAVEISLDESFPDVGKSYKDYRNYKKDFIHMMDEVYRKSQSIRYIGDKDNANTDSALVATKRSLIFNELNKELYRKFFMTKDELEACKDGYIYIHDQSARLDTFNCILSRVGTIMKDGFEMGNLWYNEPKSLDVAFDVIGDIILSTAAQQYGGYTVYEIDKLLIPYAEKSYKKYFEEYTDIISKYTDIDEVVKSGIKEYVLSKVERDFDQGFQGLEMKLNSVGSSRGDYPFVTFTFGLSTDIFGKMASKSCLKVRMNGQGKEGFKKPVLFPKLVFLYDKNLHGVGCVNEDVFESAILCSSKSCYPDFLSLTGEGYVADIYKKYGTPISPMGCRSFLSPWYERGGMNPADEDDKPIYEGRFNMGVVSLHLPMILAKSRQENKDFYEVLDYYLEMIRNIHKRTVEYLGEMKASVNPVMFCEGGVYGGNLNPNDKIKSILKPMTTSFGITALNELQRLYNGKSIYEDGEFALEVMKYIDKKVKQFKEEDGILHSIYGTPGESLLPLQVKQFRKKYGIIENVSDKDYMSNSFHCHVSEDITPIEKQDSEKRFWDYFNGGKIQYVRYGINYNLEALRTLVRRAMDMGFYEGVNMQLSYCDKCGYSALEMDKCPKCGSEDITKIDRVCGYLGYSRVHGDTRLNKGKMSEIADRKSM